MKDRPAGVGEPELRRVLAEGWNVDAVTLRYSPVGGGSYHWKLRDAQGNRWFVTVDDLDRKSWLGGNRTAAGTGLRIAMDTAVALRNEAGLRFVVAPVPSVHGKTTLPLGPKYAVAVFPFIEGTAGQFGQQRPAPERAQLVDMLAALHAATPAARLAPLARIALPLRGELDAALGELGQPWHGGPFSEPARTLLAERAARVRHLLGVFDELADQVRAATPPVITHGETHAGNFISTGGGPKLIDWDTVGLAPPERDLWMVIGDGSGDARRYTAATGRDVDPVALRFYRLRWMLDDTASFVRQLRAPHGETAGSEHAWQSLKLTLAQSFG